MEFLKSWLELIRDLRSGLFWWALALLASFADCYLLMRFDTGLLVWLNEVPKVFEVDVTGPRLLEAAGFVVAANLVWFYLLPLVVVPLWRKSMFELNWRLPSDYRLSPSRKDGWHWLPAVQRKAAIEGNAVLFAYCEARQKEVVWRRHLLSCVLGSLFFGFLAMLLDVTDGSSLIGTAISAWYGLSIGWQSALFATSMPGAAVLWLIISEQKAYYDPYIFLGDGDQPD